MKKQNEDFFHFRRIAIELLKDKKLYKWLHQMWGRDCDINCKGCYHELLSTAEEILRVAIKKNLLKERADKK